MYSFVIGNFPAKVNRQGADIALFSLLKIDVKVYAWSGLVIGRIYVRNSP